MNRIRIGNQSAFSAATVMLPFEYAIASGFDAFEWFPDRHNCSGWSENDIDAETRSYIRDMSVKHDISLSVHASLEAEPGKPGSLELMCRDIEFAKDIGATLMNIHLLNAESIANYINAVTPVIRHTAEAGLRLSIENTVFTGPQDFNQLFDALNKQSEILFHVGMCLDLGHANLFAGTCNDYLKYIDLLSPQVPIIHIHAHENYGDSDSHHALFSGPAGEDPSGLKGVVDRLKKRGFSGSVILEQWPQPPFLLNEARHRLKHMFNSAD